MPDDRSQPTVHCRIGSGGGPGVPDYYICSCGHRGPLAEFDAHSNTTEGIPASDFVQHVARIASVAAAWAADTMALPEDLSKPMDAGSVERFAEDILRRVYRIRERAYAKR